MDFDTFLDASIATLIPGTLSTLNLPIKSYPSSGELRFNSNYHSYKEKTVELLPNHSFYGGHIPLKKIESPFLVVRLKKIQSHQMSI